MEMWLRRSTLVLLTVAVAAMEISGQPHVILNETQHTVDVPSGSSLTFNCTLSTETYIRFRVEWFFNPVTASLTDSYKLNKTSALVKHGEQDTSFTLPNAAANDSGWYFCRVTADIPVLVVNSSNGTHVVITESMEHTSCPYLCVVTGKQATVSPTVHIDWWMWIVFGVSSFILLILLVICISLRRRHHRSREDPVYANTRRLPTKQPSPRPGTPVENLKPDSSSQNLRNPSSGRSYDKNKRRYK